MQLLLLSLLLLLLNESSQYLCPIEKHILDCLMCFIDGSSKSHQCSLIIWLMTIKNLFSFSIRAYVFRLSNLTLEFYRCQGSLFTLFYFQFDTPDNTHIPVIFIHRRKRAKTHRINILQFRPYYSQKYLRYYM